MTTLEDLSSELLLELFEYLPAEDLFIAFFNLQSRFNQILMNRSLLMHLAVAKISYIQTLFDPNQIRFVTVRSLSTPTLAADLPDCSSMPNAIQLFLYEIYVPDLMLGLSSIQSRMPNLVHISIDGYHGSSSSTNTNVNFILERLFTLPHLRTLALKFDFYTKGTTYVYLSSIKPIPSLEYFSLIGCNLSILSVIDLLTNASRLRSLQLRMELNREYPDYSIFKQLVRGTFELVGFDDINLQKFFNSMTNRVRLRVDGDTIASIARLHITQPTRITRIPKRYFES